MDEINIEDGNENDLLVDFEPGVEIGDVGADLCFEELAFGELVEELDGHELVVGLVVLVLLLLEGVVLGHEVDVAFVLLEVALEFARVDDGGQVDHAPGHVEVLLDDPVLLFPLELVGGAVQQLGGRVLREG